MENAALECPYCGAYSAEAVDIPEQPLPLQELECMPYTRDIGRFDEGKWTRIGQDFFTRFISWEEIGILRVPVGSRIDVWYRVATCTSCGELFDVYANFTPGRSFSSIWPHLLNREGGDIQPYRGDTAMTALLERLTPKDSPPWIGAALFSLALFVLTGVPQILIWGSTVMAHAEVSFVLRLLGALALTALLTSFRSYVLFMHRNSDFNSLLDVGKPDYVTHWKNFTLSRFVGVQPAKGHRITQVAVLSGYPSMIVLVISWVTAQLAQNGGSLLNELLLALGLLATGYVIASILVFFGAAQHERNLRAVLFPINGIRLRGALAGITLWFAAALIRLVLQEPWQILIASLSDLVFWAVVAFYFGIGVQFAFNTSTYILRGATRLPMRLDPLNHFRNLGVLERLAGFSFSTLTTIAVFILLLVIGFTASWPPNISAELARLMWIFMWATIGVILLFAVLGIAISKLMMLGTLLYALGLLFLPGLFQQTIAPCAAEAQRMLCTISNTSPLALKMMLGGASFYLYPNLLLLGLFLSFTVYLHVRMVSEIIRAVKQRAKDRAISEWEIRIESIRKQLLQPHDNPEDISALANSMQSLLQLRDYVESQNIDISLFRRIAGVTSPLLSTVILPIVLDQLTGLAKHITGLSP